MPTHLSRIEPDATLAARRTADPSSPETRSKSPYFDTVAAPLFHWARQRPNVVALDDGTHSIDFAVLAQQVERLADRLRTREAPPALWLGQALAMDDAPGHAQQQYGKTSPISDLVAFLAIIASGRIAAVADPDWPESIREALRQVLSPMASHAQRPSPEDPFYIGFTSGSTGLPKGFQRNHRSWAESFDIVMRTFGDDARLPVFCPGRLSHSLFLFAALQGIWSGGGVRIQPRFSPGQALAVLSEGEHCVVAVPSQLIMMLEYAARRGQTPLHGVKLLMISGARWMRDRTPALRELFPHARIVEYYGASETSFVAWTDADENLPPDVVGHPFSNVEIKVDEFGGPGEPGLIYVRSAMLFDRYVRMDSIPADDSAAVRDGDWLSVRDIGRLDQHGRLCLIGRQKRMIVTKGKNLFPEEVEQALVLHPAVRQASVQGVADRLRGMEVVAVVQFAADCSATGAELSAWCHARLERYKAPRQLFASETWPTTSGGKTDHPALAEMLSRVVQDHAADPDRDEDGPCLIAI